VRESTAAVGGYDLVIVWLMDDSQKRLVNPDGTVAGSPAEPRRGNGTRLAARAAKSGRITFEGPAGQVRFSDNNRGPVRAIAIPLIVGARVVGALEARHNEPQMATIETIEILEMLATHAATAIESARLHEVIAERSQMDALTCLSNRRRLDEDLDAECKRCTRYGRPLAFVMLDVDRFESCAAPTVTASFGVAEFSAATPAPRALIEAADAAMYESKHAGRNRVTPSSTPPSPAAAPRLAS
jgi:predicted signal transduction protein with EAL and GGDEF domain